MKDSGPKGKIILIKLFLFSGTYAVFVVTALRWWVLHAFGGTGLAARLTSIVEGQVLLQNTVKKSLDIGKLEVNAPLIVIV